MSANSPLNLFYEEPDPDRWLPYDRHVRRVVRRLVRGPSQPGGAERAFLNLVAGLDRLGTPYRINDYRHLAAHRGELACVFGKPHVLEKIPAQTPILFGTSIYSHPNDDRHLPDRRAIRQVLVPSEWVQRMFSEVWPGIVSVCPAGIDTQQWIPAPAAEKDIDVLIYDKIFWKREHYEQALITPLRNELGRRGLRVEALRYGTYREADLLALSRRSRSMVYLSRHETQGIAAQQMLSADVPLFAWDRGDLWQDPKYAPHQVRFGPVTSVPYWDDRCGVKFTHAGDLVTSFDVFWRGIENGAYAPREVILEKFTLEERARAYLHFAEKYA
jgi:hypothetical protein